MGFHDRPAIQKDVGDGQAGTDQSPRVVPEIEDQTVNALGLQVLQRFGQLLGHRFSELCDADVAQAMAVGFEQATADGLQIHLPALEFHLLVLAARGDQLQQNGRSFLAPQPCGRGFQAELGGADAVDLAEHAGAADARFSGG